MIKADNIETMVSMSFTVTATSYSTLADDYGGLSFDLNHLLKQFAKICPDIDTEIDIQKAYDCVGFAILVIFKIGPMSRDKSSQGDKRWKILFPNEKIAYICTHRNSIPEELQPTEKNNKIILTLKQASLLSCIVLQNGASKLAAINKFVFTPLTGAVFNKVDIPQLAAILCPDLDTPEAKLGRCVTLLNNSCQSGGFYMEYSDANVALAAAVCSTINAKPSIRKSILRKVVRQYMQAKKNLDVGTFKKVLAYANGGIPMMWSEENIMKMYEEVKSVASSLTPVFQK